jgi:hypothetical protein
MAFKDDDAYFFAPRAIACQRGSLRTGISYDAELAFDRQHYLVSSGHASSPEAMSAAQVKVEELVSHIRNSAASYVKQFSKAKP